MCSYHTPGKFSPGRTASWWSAAEDLLWPEKRAKDKIKRRADALAEAGVNTVIQFGFHFRFDFAWYFGALHGYFAETAEALHQRGIKFIDHYSCNLVARPNSEEERIKYHSFQRHHVDLYPDKIAAETASYAGYRFNDLCEKDLITGQRAYTPIYQAEMFCHNNPAFLSMHESYLKRLLAEVPVDGMQVDDMCCYNYFRSCGCQHCRKRFQWEYGRELPPLSDKGFWGDSGGHPSTWGNYESPAFRDWVQMRYKVVSDHLAKVRRIIGPERVLMTCCSCSGPMILNSLALSYERILKYCDWVNLENCGLAADGVQWARMEPEALLQKSIGRAKDPEAAPGIACSYTIYEDGAYLGWAIARFWGVANWISTLTQGLIEHPVNVKEEAELIAPYNEWECQQDNVGIGDDVVEVRLAFWQANKENGYRSPDGTEYWEHVKNWSLAFLDHNIGYRFLLSREFDNPSRLFSDMSPVFIDSCAYVSDIQYQYVKEFLGRGGQVFVLPPFGTHTSEGELRAHPLLEDLQSAQSRQGLIILDARGPETLSDLLVCNRLSPLIKITGTNNDWRIRIRQTSKGLAVHLLNQALEGVEHPTLKERWGQLKVLKEIRSKASNAPLSFELDINRLNCSKVLSPKITSPEFNGAREASVEYLRAGKIRLTLDLKDIRLYAMCTL